MRATSTIRPLPSAISHGTSVDQRWKSKRNELCYFIIILKLYGRVKLEATALTLRAAATSGCNRSPSCRAVHSAEPQ